jgi:hypothetical protein
MATNDKQIADKQKDVMQALPCDSTIALITPRRNVNPELSINLALSRIAIYISL